MASIIGEELKKWKESLTTSDLNSYDITVINIILENFDALIQAGGTAGAKRIKTFAELVNAKQGKCDSALSDISVDNSSKSKRINRIDTLKVDSFRGFATSRTFDLKKQYVLLYGPNGSGKTSFSEALEYGLLGNIEEAESNRIKLATYIKNTSTDKGESPVISCTFEDGFVGKVEENYDAYRFAFIEKNRITDFSHISALNSKSQNDKIAALFGLSEFSNFVREFTKNFDDRYLPISSETEKKFELQKVARDTKNVELSKLENELQNLQKNIQGVVDELSRQNKEIESLQQASDYLDVILTAKLQNKANDTVELIDGKNSRKICSSCKVIRDSLEIVVAKRNELANKSLEVNYRQLYEIVSKLDKTDECPICGTVISQAKRNPYDYAKIKLCEYKEIDSIKDAIHDKAHECKTLIDNVYSLFDTNKELFRLGGIDTSILEKVPMSDIEKYEKSVKYWHEFSKQIVTFIDGDITDKINEYNENARKKNTAYDNVVNELKQRKQQLTTLSTQLAEKEKQINDAKVIISDFDNNSSGILLKINEEKNRADYNKKIMEAYHKIVCNLQEYVAKLPGLMAHDLEEKIVDYYNTINDDDADFEKLSNINLPNENSTKLELTFRDGTTADALLVLSEGHIKILGLSILLAKAIKEKLNFIIFDDVVNAIDDDHREGVAHLIMRHDDFKNVQIILSTHGEQFVLKLKDKLDKCRREKDVIVYKFLPTDSLRERGIVASYFDAKTPIEAAQKNFEEHNLKDAASKCRQAMECIAYNLWNKISKIANGQLSVLLKNPKSIPDLYSVVCALIKKNKEIQGMENIKDSLEKIMQDDNWRVMNKGTHFEGEQQEFERGDVRKVLDILTTLDDDIRSLKIQLSTMEQ